MSTPKPFKINIPDSRISRLKQKLSLTDWPRPINGLGWEHGIPVPEVQKVAAYWENEYDWKTTETKLNDLPMFILDVPINPIDNVQEKSKVEKQFDGGFDGETVNLHFVHQRSPNVSAVPLIFIHGWPGSSYEGVKLLPLLRDKFHIIIPSLPGFTFSSAPPHTGFTISHHASVLNNLMHLLGYPRYVSQSGDWGYMIARAMAELFPSSLLSSHYNFMFRLPPSPIWEPGLLLSAMTGWGLSAKEKRGLARSKWFMDENSGYRVMQSSKPVTLGVSLTDSPAGLLAWIMAMIKDLCDPRTKDAFTMDDLCTWVSLYYFTDSVTSASMIYYENFPHYYPKDAVTNEIKGLEKRDVMIGGMDFATFANNYIDMPIGIAHFPYESVQLPKAWLRTLGRVIYEKEYDEGGHFAAWEQPERLKEAVEEMWFRTEEGKKVVERIRAGWKPRKVRFGSGCCGIHP